MVFGYPDGHPERSYGLTVPNARASLWLRWPDVDNGPLWLGVHLNERAGVADVVGIELWTEPPGDARQSLGPAADMADDLLPWEPIPLRGHQIRQVSLTAIRDQVARVLASSGESARFPGPLYALRPPKRGRAPIYPPAHFARVAGVYGRAVADRSRSPTVAVAQAWTVSRSTAAKWVMRARADGLIPPVAKP